MSIHFHKLAVKEVNKETADCVTILFDIPDNLKKNLSIQTGTEPDHAYCYQW